MAGNVVVLLQQPRVVLFSFFFSRRAQAGTSKIQPASELEKPDFYDTCDAGVLIGKLPCTSTLAQSVAATPRRRKGRPGVMYHMNCLHMCHAVVNNAVQIH